VTVRRSCSSSSNSSPDTVNGIAAGPAAPRRRAFSSKVASRERSRLPDQTARAAPSLPITSAVKWYSNPVKVRVTTAKRPPGKRKVQATASQRAASPAAV
jgi:hypothetical protein